MDVGVTVSPDVLNEEESTVATLIFALSAPPPKEGLVVSVDSDIARSPAEFNLFAASFDGAQLVSANNDAENEGGAQQITYRLQPGEGYNIAPNADSVKITIVDTEQNTPLPPIAKGAEISPCSLVRVMRLVIILLQSTFKTKQEIQWLLISLYRQSRARTMKTTIS